MHLPQDHSAQSNLVIVLETSDQMQLAMAKGLLEDAEIPLFIDGQIATLIQEVDGFLHKRVRLRVPSNREDEAQELLEQLVQPIAHDQSDPTES